MSGIAIVGGGVIGLCAAIALRTRGVAVSVYDGPAGQAGASTWNCGWLTPSHSHPLPGPDSLRRSLRWLLSPDAPLSMRPDPRLARWLLGFAWSSRAGPHARGLRALAGLMREALPAWQRLEAEGLVIPWTSADPLVAFLGRSAMDGAARRLAEAADLGVATPRILDAVAAREREPALSGAVVGAIELRGERTLDPARLLDALRSRLASLGVPIRQDEPVSDVGRRGGRVRAVITPSGAQPCDALVLAAGAWSGALARRLGARLPVTSGRGYVVDLGPPDGDARRRAPARSVQLAEASMVVVPLGEGVRLCGTMELAAPASPLDERRTTLMMRAPGGYLDGWDPMVPPLRVEVAPRPLTPDGLPIIGPLRAQPDVIVATGHGMLGMTLGALTGELVARLVVDGRADIPDAFAPARFRW